MEIKYLTQKRGLIFSLDAAIAVSVVVIILITSAYYISTASRESVSQIQLLRMGSDLLLIFERTGALDQIVNNDIQNPPSESAVVDTSIINISKYLPPNYNATIEISDLRETVINAASVICVSPPVGQTDCCTVMGCNGTFNVSTMHLTQGGNYFVMVGTSYTKNGTAIGMSSPTGVLPFFTKVGNNRFVPLNTHPFSFGVSSLKVTANDTAVIFVKILGEKAYSANTSVLLPSNTFIGTGERMFSYVNGNTFEPRYVKFYIWIK